MSDQRIERIETKVDKVLEQQAEMNNVLAKQHEQLIYHIRRTDLLEQELKPIAEHVTVVKGIIRLIGVGAAVAAIIRLFL